VGPTTHRRRSRAWRETKYRIRAGGLPFVDAGLEAVGVVTLLGHRRQVSQPGRPARTCTDEQLVGGTRWRRREEALCRAYPDSWARIAGELVLAVLMFEDLRTTLEKAAVLSALMPAIAEAAASRPAEHDGYRRRASLAQHPGVTRSQA